MNETGKPPNDDFAELLRKIDSLSDDFRQAWKRGQSPELESYIDDVPAAAQEHLFRTLLSLEIRYRHRRAERPTADDYLDRFPKFRRLIIEAFHETSSFSLDPLEDNKTHDRPDVTLTIGSTGSNRLGEYELIREIGRGGFGVVFEAKHRTRGDHVALKSLPLPTIREEGEGKTADRLRRFRQEFRSLAEINHPNLVGMQTLEFNDNLWFLTMDLVDGIDFLSHVRPDNSLDLKKLRKAARQLAEGILALHENQILHRDLKPSNVMVDQNDRVVILDFGLVAEADVELDHTASAQSQNFAGTPKYAAPEQIFGQRSPASDWYSFGTILFEALTGKLPFEGNATQVLLSKQNAEPPRLSGMAELPRDFAELVDRLLDRIPDHRPLAAEIMTFFEIDSQATGTSHLSTGSRADLEGDDGDSIDVDATELFGRETQLSQLQKLCHDWLETTASKAVFLSGKSGEGKSALANVFLRPVRKGQKQVVFSGRCYERESIPFKAIDCWIESLVRFLNRKSTAWLSDNLPADIVALARIFPAFQRIEFIRKMPVDHASRLTAERLRHRAFSALQTILEQISQQQPIVIFVDDLQWADAESVSVFDSLLTHVPALKLLFLGTYRVDEFDSSPFLTVWKRGDLERKLTTISVGALSEEEARELILSFLPKDAQLQESQVANVYQESAGNPYLLAQLVDSYDRQSGHLQPAPLGQLISKRLRRLPKGTRDLLELLAVAGHDLELRQLDWFDRIPTNPFALLTKMRKEKLVRFWGRTNEERIDTYHDKIRETILEEMSESERRRWHRIIAEGLAQVAGISGDPLLSRPPDDPFGPIDSQPVPFNDSIPELFDLADHYFAAQHPLALPFQVLAGEQALRIYSNQDARRFLEQANQMLDGTHADAMRYRVKLGLGRALYRCQSSALAVEELKQAVKFAATSQDKIRAHYLLGLALSSLGQLAKAVEHFENALLQLGKPRAGSRPLMFVKTTTRIAKLVASSPPKESTLTQDQLRQLKIESILLTRLAESIFELDALSVVDVVSKAAAVSYQTGEANRIKLGHSFAAMGLAGIGMHRFGRRFLKRLDSTSLESTQANTRALIEYQIGATLFFQARLPEASQHLERAYELTLHCGDPGLMVTALHLLRNVRRHVDGGIEELQTAKLVMDAGRKSGDRRGTCWGFQDVADAQARLGNLVESAEHLQKALASFDSERWYITESNFGTAQGFCLLQFSQAERAQKVLKQAWTITRSRWNFIELALLCLPIYLESLAGHDWLSQRKRRVGRDAKRAAFWNRMLQRNHPALQPDMLRSLGRFAAHRGKERLAIRYFERALQGASALHMDYSQARASLDLAVVARKDTSVHRGRAIELLRKTQSVIPWAERWQLGDNPPKDVVAPEFDLDHWESLNEKISLPRSLQFNVETNEVKR